MSPRWNHYFFAPLPVLPLAIFRAGVGLMLFSYYVRVGPVFYEVFAPAHLGSSYLTGWLPQAPEFFVLLHALCLASAFTTALGFHTRWSVIALFCLHSLVAICNPSAFWGWGIIVRHFLFFLIFTPCGARLSLDRWRGSGGVDFAPAWTYRLFQFQIMMIYAVTVLHRVPSEDWWSGSAVALALADDWFSRFPFVDWLQYDSYLRPFTFAGWLLECLGAVLAFLGPLRSWIALGLIFFHVVLEATTVLQQWQILMILGLIFFLPPGWFARAESAGTAPPEFRIRRAVPAGIVTAFVLMAVNAAPEYLFGDVLQGPRAKLSGLLARLKLDNSRHMRMFSFTRLTGRDCVMASGLGETGIWSTIYSSEGHCNPSGPRLNYDEKLGVINRLLIHRRYGSLGRYFCNNHPNLKQVSMFSAAERIERGPGGTFRRVPGIKPYFVYDCRSEAFDDSGKLPPAVTARLKEILKR